MSYTVVEDPDYRDRRLENRLNAVVRRCRIGMITWKKPVSIPSVFTPWAPNHPDLSKQFQWPIPGAFQNQFMSKCGCRIGTACNNAACPHAPVVTC
jgi:hypothetical protein